MVCNTSYVLACGCIRKATQDILHYVSVRLYRIRMILGFLHRHLTQRVYLLDILAHNCNLFYRHISPCELYFLELTEILLLGFTWAVMFNGLDLVTSCYVYLDVWIQPLTTKSFRKWFWNAELMPIYTQWIGTQFQAWVNEMKRLISAIFISSHKNLLAQCDISKNLTFNLLKPLNWYVSNCQS